MTSDDYRAVEEYLRREYFFVRSQTVWIVVALLAAFGVGTVVAAYNAAKATAAAEAEKIAKEEAEKVARETVDATTAKRVTDEILKMKEVASADLADIQANRKNADVLVSGMAPLVPVGAAAFNTKALDKASVRGVVKEVRLVSQRPDGTDAEYRLVFQDELQPHYVVAVSYSGSSYHYYSNDLPGSVNVAVDRQKGDRNISVLIIGTRKK